MRRVIAAALLAMMLVLGSSVQAHPTAGRICVSEWSADIQFYANFLFGWNYWAWKYPGYEAGHYTIAVGC